MHPRQSRDPPISSPRCTTISRLLRCYLRHRGHPASRELARAGAEYESRLSCAQQQDLTSACNCGIDQHSGRCIAQADGAKAADAVPKARDECAPAHHAYAHVEAPLAAAAAAGAVGIVRGSCAETRTHHARDTLHREALGHRNDARNTALRGRRQRGTLRARSSASGASSSARGNDRPPRSDD